jgi:hypothetical protein
MENWRNGDIETWTWRYGHRGMDRETWTGRHGKGYMDMETWTWRYGNGDIDMGTLTYRHGDMELHSGTKNMSLLRPGNFTPLHSLTGPVGQPFASRLGGQRLLSQGCINSQWNQVFPVSVVSLQYIGDPEVIDHWPRPRHHADNRNFTRLHADNVKSQL